MMNGQKKNPNQTMILRIIIEKKKRRNCAKKWRTIQKGGENSISTQHGYANKRKLTDRRRRGEKRKNEKEREREREREAGTVDSISDDGLLFQRQRQHPAGDRFRATAVPSISRIIKLSLPRHKQPPRPPITCSLSLSLSLSLPPSLLIIDGTHTDARAHSI